MYREAAVLTAPGRSPVIVREPIPVPGPGDIVVAMRRAPINPADLLMLDGRYAFAAAPPVRLGAEGVGVVTTIGAQVRSIAPGDTVLPLARGNWASHRLLDEQAVIPIPASLPIDQAAMLRINPATAWRLVSLGMSGQKLMAGDWIIQNGGRSAVAHWVRMIAVARGCHVANIVRSGREPRAEDHEIADGDDLTAAVERLAAGARVPLALDCVAGAATGRLAAALSPGGQIIVFGHLSGASCDIPSTLLTGRSLSVHGFSLRPAEAADSHADLVGLYAALADLMARPNAVLPIAATYPLDRLDTAIAHAREGRGGRIMLALDA
jgi:NADPH:quinone reductase-like Zn-dependent oxidoreductase